MAGYSPTNADSREYSWMSSIEERLETLESEARLFRASVKGGAIVAYTDELKQVARLGEGGYGLPNGQTRTAPVFAVSDGGGSQFHQLVDTEYGWRDPAFRFNFVEDTFKAITNSSFENCWKSSFNLLGHAVIVRHLVTADSGTTGEYRLQINGIVTSDIVSIAAGEQKQTIWAWNLTDQLTLTGGFVLKVQARRVSGTGNINVYAPDDFYVRSAISVPEATPGGIPSS